ncbi:Outer arm dynein light chain 1 protein [Abeliophyllum distichum]|uniref:Outer arm dynein light chain 1 protein n=1 Tax=Abeliophyllum distichum TaxID=126358 RepID=A0ABD1QWA3_9LAMI
MHVEKNVCDSLLGTLLDDNDECDDGGEVEASDTEIDCDSIEYNDDADRSNDREEIKKRGRTGQRRPCARRLKKKKKKNQITLGSIENIRAYVSDLSDHRALEQLRRILRLLPSLKVVSVLPQPGRDPTPLYLLPFGRLKILELRGCDLSSSAARGLLELRHTLEKLICHNSTDALRHVFTSRIVEIKDSPQWNRLSFVSCACNGLMLMDESLQLLPAAETLDLSRNKFAKVDNLWKCTKLKHLDLGFNNLISIASFSEVSCQIVKLVLRNNALTTLRGIENLKSLMVGRESSLFCKMLKLDEKRMSPREFWKRQIIVASQQNQPASFGFYSPAKGDADLEHSINTNRKKISRLVSLESEEQSTYIYSDQDSVSCDIEIQTKDENDITDDEAEIEDFLRRIELMKKERCRHGKRKWSVHAKVKERLRTSFPQWRQEWPSVIDTFKVNHQRNGKWVNERAAQDYEKMVEEREVQTQQASSSSMAVNERDVVLKVLGERRGTSAQLDGF